MLLAILIINILIFVIALGNGRAFGETRNDIAEIDSKLNDLKERFDELWPPEKRNDY